MHDALQRMASWLRREDAFLLVAHVSPDGDTVGSCLALYAILRGMGKRVQVCSEQPLPQIYRFLPYAQAMLPPEKVGAFQNAVAVDCADMRRMGSAAALYMQAAGQANIDHHRTNEPFGTYVLHDHTAAATGELVFALWETLEAPKDNPAAKEIATCLFTAISTDTGNFAFPDTTPQTHRIAARLMEMGVDSAEVNERVFHTFTLARTYLKGFILSSIQLFAEGRIGYARVMQADLQRFGAVSEDMEGMVNGIRDIDTVEIAIMLREATDGSFKVSLRSKFYVDASALAQQFDGGGHLRAAAFSFVGDLQSIEQDLFRAAQAVLK